MAKFFGAIGLAENMKTAPGVYEDVIVEKPYSGDLVRTNLRLSAGDQVNTDLSVNNSVSIVADAYLREHLFAIRYVKWAGTLWSVNSITAQSPRLLLELGGVYNGPRPGPST